MRSVLYIQFDFFFFNIFPKNMKEKRKKNELNWDEMKWHWNYCMSFLWFTLLNLSINEYYCVFCSIIRSLIDVWKKKFLQQFPLFTLFGFFSDKRLICRHKCTKHFTQFVQFLFFYLTFFNAWLKRHLKTYISSFLAAILYCWSHFYIELPTE